ncbi:MAG: tetratricopeptide repeat protein, partial [Candidatus Omnitrophota bacterium]
IGRRFPEFSSLLNPDALQSFLVIISLISISIASYKRLPLLSFAILWFFVNLLPKFIATLSLLAAEQHLYLPAIGIFIAITLFLERLFYIVEARKKQALKILIASVATVILIFFSVLTIRRNNIWKDEYSLWLNNVGCSPSSMAGYNNLGLAALNKGKLNEAENYFIIALEEIKKRPIIPRALKIRLHLNLSSTYLEKDDFDLAEEHLREALAINPNIAEIHNNLGLLFAKKGLRDKEIYHLKRAIELDPSFVLAYNNLGVSYYYEGEIDLAIETLKTAIKVNPDYSKPYIGLAFIYEKLGNLGEAVYFKSRALELLNGSALDYYKLGIVYGELGDKRAVEAFKKAISLEPKFAAAHNNLAVTYANLEPPENDLARKHAKLALKYGYKVDPNFLKQLRIPDFK